MTISNERVARLSIEPNSGDTISHFFHNITWIIVANYCDGSEMGLRSGAAFDPRKGVQSVCKQKACLCMHTLPPGDRNRAHSEGIPGPDLGGQDYVRSFQR